MEGNCPRQVPSGLLYLACPQEFLLGGFASHGRSELLVSRFLPTQLRWPSLHSHLDQLLGGQWWRWLPHPLQLLCLFHSLLHLFCPWWSLFNWGWGVNWRGGLLPFSAIIILTVLGHNTLFSPPFSPFLSVTLVLAMLEFRWGRLGNVEASKTSVLQESCGSHFEFLISTMPFWKVSSVYTMCSKKKRRYHGWGVQKIQKDSEKGGWGI